VEGGGLAQRGGSSSQRTGGVRACVRAARENWVSEWWHWCVWAALLVAWWPPASPSCQVSCPPLCRKQEWRANRGPAHQTSTACSESLTKIVSIVSHSSFECGRRGAEEISGFDSSISSTHHRNGSIRLCKFLDVIAIQYSRSFIQYCNHH
jgi:hypothetical protein